MCSGRACVAAAGAWPVLERAIRCVHREVDCCCCCCDLPREGASATACDGDGGESDGDVICETLIEAMTARVGPPM